MYKNLKTDTDISTPLEKSVEGKSCGGDCTGCEKQKEESGSDVASAISGIAFPLPVVEKEETENPLCGLSQRIVSLPSSEIKRSLFTIMSLSRSKVHISNNLMEYCREDLEKIVEEYPMTPEEE